MKIKTYISIFELQNDGSRILKQKRIANSLVEQFNEWLFAVSYATVSIYIKDIGGTERNLSAFSFLPINAPSSNSNYGIVVGMGSNEVLITNFKLQSKISHGSGANQLAYSSMTFVAAVSVGSYNSWKVSRSFINNSGNSITINEIGIDGLNSGWYFLLERTVVTPYPVANGAGCVVQYEIKIEI